MPKNLSLNKLRIIGGKWRGRKFNFPAIPGLRPTPDRVRETLFNWLAPIISGAHCLDLFAGSGALGLEALSRGAGEVVFMDQSPVVIQHLKQQIQTLNITNAIVQKGTVPLCLLPCTNPFNIIFLDPPFHQNLIARVCSQLEEQNYLADGAYIYIEAESILDPLPIPSHWEILRSKIAGQVGYHLVKCS